MTEQLTEQPPSEQDAPTLVSGPVRVSWATVARVNLLPLEILQRRRLRRTKTYLGIMVFAGIVIAAAGVFLAQRDVDNARDDLTVAQAQVASLNADAAKYSAVPAVIAQVDAASAARTDVMSSDVPWYQFMSDLAGALPAGVTQSSVSVALTPKSGTSVSGGTAASPLSATGVGTLTITGEAQQYQEVSAWLDALSKVNGVNSPALTNATKSDTSGVSTITYSISASITDAAFSHRYDKEGS